MYRMDLFWRCFLEVGAISAWCKVQAWKRAHEKFRKQCPLVFPVLRDGSSVCAVARLSCSEMERTGRRNKGTFYLPINNRCSFQMCANSDNVGSSFIIWAMQHPNRDYDPKYKGAWLLYVFFDGSSLIRFLCSSWCLPTFSTDKKILSTCSGLLQIFP